jgi:hypothetical protein
MKIEITSKIEKCFKKYATFPTEGDLWHINYVEAKLFDSISFVKMISEIETEFNVIFSSQDMQSEEFRTASGIIKIIANKLSNS